MNDPEDMEALAAQEHKSWAGWTKWMLGEIEKELQNKQPGSWAEAMMANPAGEALEMLRALDCVKRWQRQMEASYDDLSEKEKESDRKVVREKLALYRC